jgi:hypothetical protein
LSYVIGSPDDEAYHAKIHGEYQFGPEVTAVRAAPLIEARGDLTIRVVDGTVPLAVRRKFYDVALVACREIGGPAGYDGTVDEDEQRLFLAAQGNRVVAMVLTALDYRFWALVWQPDGSIVMRGQGSLHNSQRVARVWVAANHRRRGLGIEMVRIASRHLQCPIDQFGWELPLTAAGAQLVRRLLPTSFWGSGDQFALQETLESRFT